MTLPDVHARTTEDELLAGLSTSGILLTPYPEVAILLERTAREVARIGQEVETVRELVELLVDWAGARDRVPADEEPDEVIP